MKQYLCHCACGNERVVIEATLLSGKTKSCGCWRSAKGSADIDLTGQTFGYWTVVEPAEKKQGKQYYHCRCICGKKGTMKVYRQLQKRDIAEGGYQFAPLKNNKTRVIKLSPFVLKLLEKQKIKQREDKLAAGDLWQGFQTIEEQKTDFVFTTKTGNHLCCATLYNNFKRIAAQIGAPNARVHDLRHTFAVNSLQCGDDYKTVQGALGHATAAFTLDVYGHVSERMMEEHANRQQAYIKSLGL